VKGELRNAMINKTEIYNDIHRQTEVLRECEAQELGRWYNRSRKDG